MLNLQKLEIFATVVQEGSFSAAAERLLMSQPAVSQHIQVLESALGVTLFNRGRRGATLTPAGSTLYEYTQRILALVAEAENAVADIENLAGGQVAVGATPGVSVYMLPDWVKGFHQRYPQVSVASQTDITTRIADEVLAHHIDVGIVEGELDTVESRRLASQILGPIRLYVIVGQGHEWWEHTAVAVRDLHQQPFITRQPGSRTRVWIDGILAEHDVRPQLVAEFDNPEAIKQAVMANMGLTILPEYAIQREQQAGLLAALPVRDVTLQRNLKLIWDDQTPFKPAVRALLLYLSEMYPALRELARPGR